MAEMLELAAGLPEITMQPGEFLCTEGGAGGSIWVLISGSLVVLKGGVQVNAINRPGAIIGEVGVLLGSNHSASVQADTVCRLHYAADGAALLRTDPEITTYVATGLAERLNFLTTYLADLRHQYGDAPGL